MVVCTRHSPTEWMAELPRVEVLQGLGLQVCKEAVSVQSVLPSTAHGVHATEQEDLEPRE